MWYAALLLDAMGSEFETVSATVVEKLRKRYPEKFAQALAYSQDLEAERQTLEGRIDAL